MHVGHAALLGVIQGLTEFLPVSSSGHLAVVEHVFRMQTGEEATAFVVAVHFASLAAILTMMWSDVVRLFTSQRRLLLLLAVGTVPLAVLGKLMADPTEAMFKVLWVPGVALIGTAGFLLMGDRLATERQEAREAKWWDALIIGLAQVVAMVPGLSRSGLTISSGLVCGLKRTDAVRFSFLLAVPAILAATAYELLKAWRATAPAAGTSWVSVLAGMVASYVFSVLAIRVMLKRVGRTRLAWFAAYCAIVGVAVVVLSFVLKHPVAG